MIKEKLLSLYEPVPFFVALFIHCVLEIPFMVSLVFSVQENRIYSGLLAESADEGVVWHYVLFCLSVIIIPILVYWFIKKRYESNFREFIYYLIFYFLLINTFLIVPIELYFISTYQIASFSI